MYVDYAKQAEEYRREVSRDYYRARRYARDAAREYQHAAFLRRQVAWLADRPDIWDAELNPTAYDRYARASLRLADTLLDSSFGYTERARFHAGLARDYDEMARR